METVEESFPDSYKELPIRLLRPSSRKKLAKLLNLPRERPVRGDVVPDFTGLAQLADFDFLEIENFRRESNPTMAILEEWQQRPDLKPTVGRLVECLQQMERDDVLTDCLPSVVKDIEAFLNKEQQFDAKKPTQEHTVSSTPPPLRHYSDHHVNEHLMLTVQDVQQGCPQYYDAFVCYNPEGEDLAFVKEMLQVLESDRYGLKMFVPWRDDLPGSSTHTVSATLIQERCKRMVIIMSLKFLASPACDFQTKFAHSLSPGSRSKKLVPVLIKNCFIPLILRHVTLCDYTKGDLKEWFWERLAWTIKAPIDPEELEYQEDVSLSDICLDVSTSGSSQNPWQASPQRSSSTPPSSLSSPTPSTWQASPQKSSSTPPSSQPITGTSSQNPWQSQRSSSSSSRSLSLPITGSSSQNPRQASSQRSSNTSSSSQSLPITGNSSPWQSSSQRSSSSSSSSLPATSSASPKSSLSSSSSSSMSSSSGDPSTSAERSAPICSPYPEVSYARSPRGPCSLPLRRSPAAAPAAPREGPP